MKVKLPIDIKLLFIASVLLILSGFYTGNDILIGTGIIIASLIQVGMWINEARVCSRTTIEILLGNMDYVNKRNAQLIEVVYLARNAIPNNIYTEYAKAELVKKLDSAIQGKLHKENENGN